MSNIVVMTFDSVDEAAKVRQTLRDVQRGKHLNLDDAAVIAKDAAGNVQVQNEVDTGVKWGVLGGTILGPLLMFLFPLALRLAQQAAHWSAQRSTAASIRSS